MKAKTFVACLCAWGMVTLFGIESFAQHGTSTIRITTVANSTRGCANLALAEAAAKCPYGIIPKSLTTLYCSIFQPSPQNSMRPDWDGSWDPLILGELQNHPDDQINDLTYGVFQCTFEISCIDPTSF